MSPSIPVNFDRLKKLFWVSIGGQFILLTGVVIFLALPGFNWGTQTFLLANAIVLTAFLGNVYLYRKNINLGLTYSNSKQRLVVYIQTVMLQLSFLEMANLIIVLLIFWKHELALIIPGLLCVSLFWYFRPTAQRLCEDLEISNGHFEALLEETNNAHK